MFRTLARGFCRPAFVFAMAVTAMIAGAAPARADLAQCQSMSERGRHETAIRACSGVIDASDARSGARAVALFFRANSYYSTGERAAALDDVEAALAADDSDGRVYALRGAIRLANGGVRDAIADFDRAIELGFDDQQLRRQRADAWLALGEPSNALADLEAVATADARDPVALTQLALARHVGGDIAGAREAIDSALKLNGNYAPAFGVRAAIALAEGDTAAALTDYSRARDAAPGKVGYRIARANVLFAAGSADLALAEVDTALAENPDFPEAIALRADIREATGDLAGALADVDVLALSGPDGALRRARLALRLELYERADGEYTQALAGDPSNAAAYFERGQTRLRLGRAADAATDFRTALGRDAALADAGLFLMRGRARFESGDLEGALADFIAEAKRDSAAPSPMIWQIRTLTELGDLDAAEIGARQFVSREPDAARAHAILGDVLLRKGDIAAGRTEHESALGLDPAYEPSLRRLDQIVSGAN